MIPGLEVIGGALAGVFSSGISAFVDFKKAKAEVAAKKVAFDHEFEMAKLEVQTLKLKQDFAMEDRRSQRDMAKAVAESRDFTSRYNDAAKVDSELVKRASQVFANILSLFRPGLAIYLVVASNADNAPSHIVTMASWAVAYYFAERARGNTTGSRSAKGFKL